MNSVLEGLDWTTRALDRLTIEVQLSPYSVNMKGEIEENCNRLINARIGNNDNNFPEVAQALENLNRKINDIQRENDNIWRNILRD